MSVAANELVAIEIANPRPHSDAAPFTREIEIAIHDLVSDNLFQPAGTSGPFRLVLSASEDRLIMDVVGETGTLFARPTIPLAPLRRLVKDYLMICDVHYAALRSASPDRIQAIDVGRRGLHNEGAEVLRDMLCDSVAIDHATSRRLFTLVCALHMRG
ncbi:MAG: UPF0262 family protein [Alphaproteobacteria bacterium]